MKSGWTEVEDDVRELVLGGNIVGEVYKTDGEYHWGCGCYKSYSGKEPSMDAAMAEVRNTLVKDANSLLAALEFVRRPIDTRWEDRGGGFHYFYGNEYLHGVIFNSEKNLYNYSCTVDLLTRSGLIEGEEAAKQMVEDIFKELSP